MQFQHDRCNFEPILDDINMNSDSFAKEILYSKGFITLAPGTGTDSGNRTTSSLAIQVDGLSIVVVSYRFLMKSFFVGFVSDKTCHIYVYYHSLLCNHYAV